MLAPPALIIVPVLLASTTPDVGSGTAAVITETEATARAQLPGLFDDIVLTQVQAHVPEGVVGKDDIDAMIGFEKQKELLGCDDVSCFTQIGGALGVSRLISFRVAQVPGQWVVTAKIIDVTKAVVLRRLSKMVPGDASALISAIPGAVAELFGKEPPADGGGSHATAPAPRGGLEIVGAPDTATCRVDGAEAGTLPCLVTDLAVGPHAVEVSAPGYAPFAGTVYVAQGETTRVTAQLRPEPVEVRIASRPPGAAVFIDEEQRGATDTTVPLPPGRHQLRLMLDGHADVEQVIDVAVGAPLELALQLEEGYSSAELASRRARLVWGSVLGGVGLAALGAFAAQAVEVQGALDALHRSPPATRDALEGRGAAIRDQALAADITLIGGAALTALGTTLLLTLL